RFMVSLFFFFFFSSRRRHTRFSRDWSSDVCSSDLFDLAKLGAALNHERDQQFTYLGLQTLYDRYFLHKDGIRFELPQVFFMRVEIGRASCRERVWVSVVAAALQHKRLEDTEHTVDP